ncbi:MAG: nucleotidyltransferase domain-containing protein [Candidatus Komeilibacteria bacterium]|nr:nucleotidyltransferase domain-containing protein [Candidatus Komeilibacteria bacterium]
MVNLEKIQTAIKTIYASALKNNIYLLIAGGSIGRGNYVPGWSDADLLLVLNNIDTKSLFLVKNCEEKLEKIFNLEIDTMIITKTAFEKLSPEKLHGKVKNFLFFINKTKILIKNKGLKLPIVNYKDFIYGFWSTYTNQEKNFLRRNADGNYKDKSSLQKLFKKNLKVIFLLLKQGFATPKLAPCTYDQIIKSASNYLSKSTLKKLGHYQVIRTANKIKKMSTTELKREVNDSIDLFQVISKILITNKHVNK